MGRKDKWNSSEYKADLCSAGWSSFHSHHSASRTTTEQVRSLLTCVVTRRVGGALTSARDLVPRAGVPRGLFLATAANRENCSSSVLGVDATLSLHDRSTRSCLLSPRVRMELITILEKTVSPGNVTRASHAPSRCDRDRAGGWRSEGPATRLTCVNSCTDTPRCEPWL